MRLRQLIKFHRSLLSTAAYCNSRSLLVAALPSRSAAILLCRAMSEESQETRYKIYTRTGDKGTSSLYNGERRRKDDTVFQALGDVDELNSALGMAREFCGPELAGIANQIEITQSRLLDVGSAIATPSEASSSAKLKRVEFSAAHAQQLEQWIDELDKKLPPLKNFILPSGGKGASFLHMARTICRRAERSATPLVDSGSTDPSVGIFLNRLSDYLFTAARFAALTDGRTETIYKKQ